MPACAPVSPFLGVGLTVQLTAGGKHIMFGNPTGRAPNIDKHLPWLRASLQGAAVRPG